MTSHIPSSRSGICVHKPKRPPSGDIATSFRIAGVAVTTALCMALAFLVIDVGAVGKALDGVDLRYATLAVVLILLNSMVALLRFRVLMDRFGHSPGWRQLFVAFSIGLFGNQFVFNIVGQSVGRAGVLRTSGVPFDRTIIVTVVERTIAFGVLGTVAVVAALFLLPDLGFEFAHSGTYFLSLVGGLTLATLSAPNSRSTSRPPGPESACTSCCSSCPSCSHCRRSAGPR